MDFTTKKNKTDIKKNAYGNLKMSKSVSERLSESKSELMNNVRK